MTTKHPLNMRLLPIFAVALLFLAGCPDDEEVTPTSDTADDTTAVDMLDDSAVDETDVSEDVINDEADATEEVEDTDATEEVADADATEEVDAVEEVEDTNDADTSLEELPENVRFYGAPPQITHDEYACDMNCIDCHSGGDFITPHPERVMCRQCHTPMTDTPAWVDNDFEP